MTFVWHVRVMHLDSLPLLINISLADSNIGRMQRKYRRGFVFLFRTLGICSIEDVNYFVSIEKMGEEASNKIICCQFFFVFSSLFDVQCMHTNKFQGSSFHFLFSAIFWLSKSNSSLHLSFMHHSSI